MYKFAQCIFILLSLSLQLSVMTTNDCDIKLNRKIYIIREKNTLSACCVISTTLKEINEIASCTLNRPT